jgi:hypothetical protein
MNLFASRASRGSSKSPPWRGRGAESPAPGRARAAPPCLHSSPEAPARRQARYACLARLSVAPTQRRAVRRSCPACGLHPTTVAWPHPAARQGSSRRSRTHSRQLPFALQAMDVSRLWRRSPRREPAPDARMERPCGLEARVPRHPGGLPMSRWGGCLVKGGNNAPLTKAGDRGQGLGVGYEGDYPARGSQSKAAVGSLEREEERQMGETPCLTR